MGTSDWYKEERVRAEEKGGTSEYRYNALLDRVFLGDR